MVTCNMSTVCIQSQINPVYAYQPQTYIFLKSIWNQVADIEGGTQAECVWE